MTTQKAYDYVNRLTSIANLANGTTVSSRAYQQVALGGVNRVPRYFKDGFGMCYCEPCRKNMQEESGQELPRTSDAQNPARRAYRLWRQHRLFDLSKKGE